MTDVLHLALTVSFDLSVPAPSNVSVACDSYGVMVEWMTDGLREQAEFLLQLIPNHGWVKHGLLELWRDARDWPNSGLDFTRHTAHLLNIFYIQKFL